MPRVESESLMTNLLFKALFNHLGQPESIVGEGKSARFSLRRDLDTGSCQAEGSLEYTLPSGKTLSHKNDILISLSGERYVAFEVKFLSSVTDQFKARSYDMMHLKQEFGGRVSGIMVYAHFPGKGIRIEQARLISYPFDHFFGFDAEELFAGENKEIADSFLPIIQAVSKFISETN